MWWGFGRLLGWKLAQVSAEVTEVWVRLGNAIYYDRKGSFPTIDPQRIVH